MMKFKLSFVLCALFWYAHALGAQIQAVGSSFDFTAAPTVTIAATQSGDALIVAYGPGSGTALAPTASGVTFTQAGSTAGQASIWVALNVPAGITTVTGNLSASTRGVLIVCEESGIATSSAVDQTAGQVQSGVTAWTTGNPATTTNANDVAYVFAYFSSSGVTNTAGTGYTALSGTGLTAGQALNTGDGDALFGERRAVSATGVYPGTGTVSTNATANSVVVLLKQASGGSCTHTGYTSAGVIATPNGSSGSYLGKTGAFVTPNCSTVNYWQPAVGNFGTS